MKKLFILLILLVNLVSKNQLTAKTCPDAEYNAVSAMDKAVYDNNDLYRFNVTLDNQPWTVSYSFTGCNATYVAVKGTWQSGDVVPAQQAVSQETAQQVCNLVKEHLKSSEFSKLYKNITASTGQAGTMPGYVTCKGSLN